MSNPGVIELANQPKRGLFKRFQIEDNIGESIHIHIDNFRHDFTISEFNNFADLVKESLKSLDILKGYDINTFDSYFLYQISGILPKLDSIKDERIKISDLKCIVYNKQFISLKPVNRTPAFKYLINKKEEFKNYSQFNYHNIENEKRLKSLYQSIKDRGYPYDNQYIVLIGDQNFVRDGQHRLSCLAQIYGVDKEIEVLRLQFKNNVGRLSPWKSNIKVLGRYLINIAKLFKRSYNQYKIK